MAKSNWYIVKNGEQIGPFTSNELRSLAAAKELMPSDLLWKEGIKDWVSAEHVKGLFDSISSNLIPPPIKSQRIIAPPSSSTDKRLSVEGANDVTHQESKTNATATSRIEIHAKTKTKGIATLANRLDSTGYTLTATHNSINDTQDQLNSLFGCLKVMVAIFLLLFFLTKSCNSPRRSPTPRSRTTNPYSSYYTDPDYNPHKIITSDREFKDAVMQETIKVMREENE
jgi:hypothetical protein